jgi:hypothetical protein
MKQEKGGMSVFSLLIGLCSAILMVSAIVLPVAADNPLLPNNDTYITPANGIRDGFNYNGNGTYHFQMLNGTQGMNAIHITDSTSNFPGGVYNSQPTSGTLYVSSTGGHTGEDDVLLLIAVNSTNETDISDFSIDLTASGYKWDPLPGAAAPTFTNIGAYNAAYYHSSEISDTFSATDYLETGEDTDVTQRWKFAPTMNYPIFGGQDMTVDQPFHLILVDLKLGAISNRFSNSGDLNDKGMVKIDYTITSNPSSSAKIAFNTYVFNHDAPQAKDKVHWLNRVNISGESGSSYSGWMVGSP